MNHTVSTAGPITVARSAVDRPSMEQALRRAESEIASLPRSDPAHAWWAALSKSLRSRLRGEP